MAKRHRAKVVVLGAMTQHKGAPLLIATAQEAHAQRRSFTFQLVGYFAPERPDARGLVRESGPYDGADLPELIAIAQPDIIWFPVRWPETFSYTLSSAMGSGAHIVAPDLGAFAERLAQRAKATIYRWEAQPSEILDLFDRIILNDAAGGHSPTVVDTVRVANDRFYPARYLSEGRDPNRVSAADVTTLGAVMSTHATGQLEACGYIRAFLPLTHESTAPLLRLIPSDGSRAGTGRVDALFVQRVAISDALRADDIGRRSRTNGTPLLYEIDDNLFHLPARHPEVSKYRAMTVAAERIAAAATAIVTSSEPLAAAMRAYNDRVYVIPNALDERIWFPADNAGLADRDRSVDRPPDYPIRVLYMGSPTHEEDLHLLRRPLRDLQRYFGQRLRLEVIGGALRHEDWYDVLPLPASAALSYPAFVRWIRERAARWHIGVCPLVDDEFNACKSFIKFLDYAAIGLPVVASRVPAYAPIAADGAPGVFVGNSSHEWTASLAHLIENDRGREQLASAGTRYVRERHTLASQARQRVDILREIL